MSFRDIVARDVARIVQSNIYGPRWPLVITSPDGQVTSGMYGMSNDVALLIDPSTGAPVSGRTITVVVVIKELFDQGFSDLPVCIDSELSKPWVVQFDDILGQSLQCKVIGNDPDYTMGITVLWLEFYE